MAVAVRNKMRDEGMEGQRKDYAKEAATEVLKTLKTALEAGLISQADYNEAKDDFLRAAKERQDALSKGNSESVERKREREDVAHERKMRIDEYSYAVKHGSNFLSESERDTIRSGYMSLIGLEGPSSTSTSFEPERKRRETRGDSSGAAQRLVRGRLAGR